MCAVLDAQTVSGSQEAAEVPTSRMVSVMSVCTERRVEKLVDFREQLSLAMQSGATQHTVRAEGVTAAAIVSEASQQRNADVMGKEVMQQAECSTGHQPRIADHCSDGLTHAVESGSRANTPPVPTSDAGATISSVNKASTSSRFGVSVVQRGKPTAAWTSHERMDGQDVAERATVTSQPTSSSGAKPDIAVLASAVAASKLGLVDQLSQALTTCSAVAFAKDAEDRTCLHYAAGYGHEECVALLLESKADTRVRDANGDVPLHFAAIHGHPMCAYSITKTCPAACLTCNYRGQTPVEVAVACERGEVLNAMLLACAGDGSAGLTVQAMRKLLTSGAVPDTWAPNGSSALMLAAAANGTDALRVLLEAGATLELQDALGRSALMFAAGNCARDTLVTLLDAGACISQRDRRGRNVLDYAPAGSEVRRLLQVRLAELEAVATRLQQDLLASLQAGSGERVVAGGATGAAGAEGKAAAGGGKKKKQSSGAPKKGSQAASATTSGAPTASATPSGATSSNKNASGPATSATATTTSSSASCGTAAASYSAAAKAGVSSAPTRANVSSGSDATPSARSTSTTSTLDCPSATSTSSSFGTGTQQGRGPAKNASKAPPAQQQLCAADGADDDSAAWQTVSSHKCGSKQRQQHPYVTENNGSHEAGRVSSGTSTTGGSSARSVRSACGAPPKAPTAGVVATAPAAAPSRAACRVAPSSSQGMQEAGGRGAPSGPTPPLKRSGATAAEAVATTPASGFKAALLGLDSAAASARLDEQQPAIAVHSTLPAISITAGAGAPPERKAAWGGLRPGQQACAGAAVDIPGCSPRSYPPLSAATAPAAALPIAASASQQSRNQPALLSTAAVVAAAAAEPPPPPPESYGETSSAPAVSAPPSVVSVPEESDTVSTGASTSSHPGDGACSPRSFGHDWTRPSPVDVLLQAALAASRAAGKDSNTGEIEYSSNATGNEQPGEAEGRSGRERGSTQDGGSSDGSEGAVEGSGCGATTEEKKRQGPSKSSSKSMEVFYWGLGDAVGVSGGSSSSSTAAVGTWSLDAVQTTAPIAPQPPQHPQPSCPGGLSLSLLGGTEVPPPRRRRSGGAGDVGHCDDATLGGVSIRGGAVPDIALPDDLIGGPGVAAAPNAAAALTRGAPCSGDVASVAPSAGAKRAAAGEGLATGAAAGSAAAVGGSDRTAGGSKGAGSRMAAAAEVARLRAEVEGLQRRLRLAEQRHSQELGAVMLDAEVHEALAVEGALAQERLRITTNLLAIGLCPEAILAVITPPGHGLDLTQLFPEAAAPAATPQAPAVLTAAPATAAVAAAPLPPAAGRPASRAVGPSGSVSRSSCCGENGGNGSSAHTGPSTTSGSSSGSRSSSSSSCDGGDKSMAAAAAAALASAFAEEVSPDDPALAMLPRWLDGCRTSDTGEDAAEQPSASALRCGGASAAWRLPAAVSSRPDPTASSAAITIPCGTSFVGTMASGGCGAAAGAGPLPYGSYSSRLPSFGSPCGGGDFASGSASSFGSGGLVSSLCGGLGLGVLAGVGAPACGGGGGSNSRLGLLPAMGLAAAEEGGVDDGEMDLPACGDISAFLVMSDDDDA